MILVMELIKPVYTGLAVKLHWVPWKLGFPQINLLRIAIKRKSPIITQCNKY